jgi:hypothetical protein
MLHVQDRNARVAIESEKIMLKFQKDAASGETAKDPVFL